MTPDIAEWSQNPHKASQDVIRQAFSTRSESELMDIIKSLEATKQSLAAEKGDTSNIDAAIAKCWLHNQNMH